MEFTAGNKRFGTADVFFFLAVFVFVYTQLFALPFTPIYFDGDTLVPVSNAMRIIRGEVIYRDFFHFISPGADLYYAALFRVFGEKIWIVNATILVLTVAQVCLLWFFSKRFLSGLAVYLPSLIFLIAGFRQFSIDGSYRLMGIVFALSAAAVLVEKRSTRNLILAGMFCAMASFFQQPRGVLAVAGICAFLLWENFYDGFDLKRLIRSGVAIVGTFAIFFCLAHVYFLWHAGAENFQYAMIGFIQTSYRADPFNNNTAYLSDLFGLIDHVRSTGAYFSGSARNAVVSAFYYLLIPYIYIVFIAYLLKKRQVLSADTSLKGLVLLCFIGVFLAIGVSAPTIIRVFHVAIPGLVILVWLCSQSAFLKRLLAPSLAALVAIGIAMSVQRQVSEKDYLDMPAGRAAFLFKPAAEKYRWIAASTSPGETFYEPNHPNFYFPFQLRNPTPLYMARDSEYTPAAQVAAVVKSLESARPRLIIWPKNWTKRPEERNPDDHMEPLWQFVRSNYVLIHTFPKYDDPTHALYGDNEVWQIATSNSNGN